MEPDTKDIRETTAHPLVSIIVITYNSSKYVAETLESAKAQTYQNIELIVSDDCSNDNTVEICQSWIDNNKERFVRTEVISVEKNTGISPNCNRGLYAAKGEWVKLIAGDDVLLENCITDFTEYCSKNKACQILFGRLYYLKDNLLKEDKLNLFYSLSPKDQFIKILKGSGIPSQASFFNRNTLMELGGFDERYKFIEDAPLWVKASEKGIYFFFMDKFVIEYRLHSQNISGSNRDSKFINEKFYFDQKNIILNEIIPRLKLHHEYISILHLYNSLFIKKIILFFGNQNNFLSTILDLLVIKSTFSKMGRLIQKAIHLL